MRVLLGLLILLGQGDVIKGQEADWIQFDDWAYKYTLDPITDNNASIAIIQNDAKEWAFAVGCEEGDYRVAVFIGGSNAESLRSEVEGMEWEHTMIWRVDRNEPVKDIWETTGFDMHLPPSAQATALVDSILSGKERLALRFGNSLKTYTVVLSLDGAKDAIEALNDCLPFSEFEVASPIVDGVVYMAKDVDQRPRLMSIEEPWYPPVLQASGIRGRVVFEFVIDTLGRVSGIKLLSSTDRRFERPAINSLRTAVFSPGRIGGLAVPVLVKQAISFTQ